MPKQPRLVPLSGPTQGNNYTWADGEFSIGRHDSNNLCLVDSSVSRRHCLIQRQGSQFKIRDLESMNRTLVNGLPVVESILRHGDEIRVGESQIVFLFEDGEADAVKEEEIINAGATLVLRQDNALFQPARPAGGASEAGSTARYLKSMLQVSTAISSARTLEVLERELMDSLVQAIPADRGAIFLAAESATGHYWTRGKGTDSEETFRVPRSILRRVQDEGGAVCLNDVLMSGPEVTPESVVLSRINSILAAPLVCGDEHLGAIYLDTLNRGAQFNDDHLQLLGGIAAVAGAPLASALRQRRLETENRRLEAELHGEHDMVGDSSRMLDVYKFIRKTAPTHSTVLIGGESGTGKELVARAIHRNSPRVNKRFIAINCAAVTETLLESEFFGHEKGAFTGATVQKRGKFEEADGGTIFLDEIGELALTLQAKLLRVLQEREFERVGGARTIKVDIRVVAATNRDLEDMSRRGAFRSDLYYRLNVVSVTMPPLRERRQDIGLLAHYLLQKHAPRVGRKVVSVSQAALNCMLSYDWPGNVRELENTIERAVVLGATDEILPDDLADAIVESGTSAMTEASGTGGKFHETIREMKRQLVMKAFEQTNQSYADTAKLLGLHPNNLHRLMKNLNLKTAH